MRENFTIASQDNVLGSAGIALGDIPAVELRDGSSSYFSVLLLIASAIGANATDNPTGVFELYASGDGVRYTLISDDVLADPEVPGVTFADALNAALPISNYENRGATFKAGHIPGRFIKLRPVNLSGGGVDSLLSLDITVW